jgi:glycine cleavage system H protein
MEFPEGLRYTKDHEWVRVTEEGAVVGITSFAQDELGEIVYVDPPAVGTALAQKGVLCVVESTKAASDVYAPISGKVIEVNARLAQEPSLINSDPYGEGWLVKLSSVDEAQVSALFSAADYQALVQR